MVDEQNQFISDASHELRTPIATLRAEMEVAILEKRLGDKEARDLIGSNLEELGKLQDLANNLLQLAHVHQKDIIYNDSISLQDVIQTAYKKIAPMAKKKHIAFSRALVSGKVKGDKNSLVEVFINLFDNAIKYSPEKTAITVAAITKKRFVTILVTDEGIGISPADLPHVFDRFYRADKSRTQDGHGLGLSIAKKIIQAHGGSIVADSIFHKGTTFTITFPLID
jgi:signal transduction histidine kinase